MGNPCLHVLSKGTVLLKAVCCWSWLCSFRLFNQCTTIKQLSLVSETSCWSCVIVCYTVVVEGSCSWVLQLNKLRKEVYSCFYFKHFYLTFWIDSESGYNTNWMIQSYWSNPKYKSLIHRYLIHFSHFCTL